MSPSYTTVFQFIETTLKGYRFSSDRTDDDAEGEDLFIQPPIAWNNVRSQIPYHAYRYFI